MLPEPSGDAEVKVESMALEVKDLTVNYGGTTAVDDVSLTVRPGEVLGLIGPNGAGKTSLIDAVTGFTKMAPGSTLALDGEDISKLVGGAAGARRHGPLLPVAGAVRGLDRARQPARRQRPARHRPPTPATWSGRSTRRCRTRS